MSVIQKPKRSMPVNSNDYGPKTGAADDHPYKDGEAGNPETSKRPTDKTTPPNAHTEIDSEADLGDPADR